MADVPLQWYHQSKETPRLRPVTFGLEFVLIIALRLAFLNFVSSV